MKRVFALLPLAILSFMLAGCSKPGAVAETAIREYDAALIKAFGSGDPAPLKAVAGEKEARKVGTLIDYKTVGGLVLESKLLALKMDSVDTTADDAITATTTESWSYFDRPLKPGAAPGKVVESEMKLRYFLKKEAGVWKVAKVEGISMKNLKP